MTITIKIIDKNHEQDINIPNEPFSLFGRLIPSYQDEKWLYSTEYFKEKEEMCFPDEQYNYDEMSENNLFIGAYDEDKCIGLGIFQESMFKYMYLYDLKVNKAYRNQKVAQQIIEMASKVAKEKSYIGIYTQAQDNNLGACLFYLNNQFVIGGLDTKVYQGTSQANKKDIFFYKDGN